MANQWAAAAQTPWNSCSSLSRVDQKFANYISLRIWFAIVAQVPRDMSLMAAATLTMRFIIVSASLYLAFPPSRCSSVCLSVQNICYNQKFLTMRWLRSPLWFLSLWTLANSFALSRASYAQFIWLNVDSSISQPQAVYLPLSSSPYHPLCLTVCASL